MVATNLLDIQQSGGYLRILKLKEIISEGTIMNERSGSNEHIYKSVDAAIRIGFISLLVIWCYSILKPLIVTVVWGIIIAVGIHPVHEKLSRFLKGKKKTSATFIVFAGISMLVVPTVFFMNATVDSLHGIAITLEEGALKVTPPKKEIASLPIIGQQIYDTWQLATTNIEEVLARLQPQIREIAPKIIGAIASFGVTIIQFVISVIIAGVFLINAETAAKGAEKVFSILVGEYVDDFPCIAAGSIRSVVQGVLGIALIQAILGGAGMLVMKIPAVGVWTLLMLILGIAQLPSALVLLPVATYVFSVSATTPAVIFLIWSIIVGLLDNILKPLLLGRGVDVPMLVILLGAIGGMISYGIVGLFVGSVILCLGYKVFEAIMEKNQRKVKNKE